MIHKTHKIFALPGALAAPADLGAFLKFRLFVVRNTRSTAHPTKHLKKAVFFFFFGGGGGRFAIRKKKVHVWNQIFYKSRTYGNFEKWCSSQLDITF